MTKPAFYTNRVIITETVEHEFLFITNLKKGIQNKGKYSFCSFILQKKLHAHNYSKYGKEDEGSRRVL